MRSSKARSRCPATVRSISPPLSERLASHGYEGWFVVEAEQDPKANPPLEMAKKGHVELMRVMALAGYEVVS